MSKTMIGPIRLALTGAFAFAITVAQGAVCRRGRGRLDLDCTRGGSPPELGQPLRHFRSARSMQVAPVVDVDAIHADALAAVGMPGELQINAAGGVAL